MPVDYIIKKCSLHCTNCSRNETINMVIDTGSNTSIIDQSKIQNWCRCYGRSDHLAGFQIQDYRKVSFHSGSHEIPEIDVYGLRIVESGLSEDLNLPSFRAGVMDVKMALPGFPSDADGILGTNALRHTAVVMGSRPGEKSKVGVFSADSVRHKLEEDQHVLDAELCEWHPKRFTKLETVTQRHHNATYIGHLIFANTTSGYFLVDTGNMTSLFCTSDNDKCKDKDKTMKLFTDSGRSEFPVPISLVRRDPPGSLINMRKWSTITPGGNIGLETLRDVRYFSEVIVDIEYGEVWVRGKPKQVRQICGE